MENTFLKKYRALLPALASGVLIALSFPVAGLSSLAWIAFVPLLYSLWQKDWRESFLSGFVFGMVYFFGTQFWIYHSINHFGGVSFIASIGVVLLLATR